MNQDYLRKLLLDIHTATAALDAALWAEDDHPEMGLYNYEFEVFLCDELGLDLITFDPVA